MKQLNSNSSGAQKLWITALFIALSFFSVQNALAQTTIWTEDFTSGTYSVTAGAEGEDGTSDYFMTTDGSNIGKSYSGNSGNFFAAQDVDDTGWTGSANPSQLTWSSIDISGYSSLSFSGYFASVATSYIDAADYVLLEYSIDGGSWTNLLEFENDGSTYNTQFSEDTDFDGDGDGTALSSTFAEFSSSISSTGSTLDLRITVSLNSGDEDFAFDSFTIEGTSSSSCTTSDIAFSDGDVSKEPGDANFTQTASYSGSETITYSSSDTDVATVDANGEVTIVAAGTTTITAEHVADGTYCDGSATYELTVACAAISAPTANAASTVGTTSFTADWDAVTGADHYEIDIYTTSGSSTAISEDFSSFSDWTDNGTATDNSHCFDYPCRALGAGDDIVSPSCNYPTLLTFTQDASSGGSGNTAYVYYMSDQQTSWTSLYSFTVSTTESTETVDLSSISSDTNVQFKFSSTFSTWYLDDVEVTAGATSYVLQDQTVSGTTSYTITGLDVNTTYYYVVRAISSCDASETANSDEITVTTLVSTDPTLVASPTSITGLDYLLSAGPSSAETFTVSGYNLTAGDIDITAPSNFEVSLDGSTYSSTVSISHSGSVSATTVYVRLASGLSEASYSGSITIEDSNAEADAVSVSVSGAVSTTECPVIEAAMVNACSGDDDEYEGNNEFFIFTTTVSAAVSKYEMNYDSDSEMGSIDKTLSGADATAKGTGLETDASSGTITSSCSYTEVTSSSTVIPANSRVIFIPSNFTRSYDLGNLCTLDLYIVYINPAGSSTTWSTNSASGNFSNNPDSGTSRYIQLTYDGGYTTNIVSYSSSDITNTDGDYVAWTSGAAVGTNGGCSYIPSVCTNPTISGDTTVNVSSTISLSVDTTGGSWSSDDTSIATVSSAGVVTAVAEGSVDIIYTVGTCVGSLTITVTAPSSTTPCGQLTTWNGTADTDWQNEDNWSNGVPQSCSNVIISRAGVEVNYPEILSTDSAYCNDITFEPETGILGVQYLNYSRAFVQMTLDRDKWYTLKAPLKNMHSGDFFFSGAPVTYMRLFNTINPDIISSDKAEGTFTSCFANLGVSLDTINGFAFNMTSKEWDYPNGCNTVDSDTTITFPRINTDSSLVKSLPMFSALTGKQYPSIATTLSRDSSVAYRFISEDDDNQIPSEIKIPVKQGLNLIGNPLMGHIDFDEFWTDNSDKIEGAVKLWNGTVYTTVITASVFNGLDDDEYISSISTDISTLNIPPLESFFVYAETEDTLVLKPAEHYVADQTATLRSSKASSLGKLYITADNGKNTSSTLVMHNENANNSSGKGDAFKLFSEYADVPELYTVAGSKCLDINQFSTYPYSAPLCFHTDVTDSVKLSFDGAEGFEDVDVYLINTSTGDEIDLKDSSSCQLFVDASTAEGALFIEFRSASVLSAVAEIESSEINIYSQNEGEITVISSPSDKIKNVYVMDVLGRQVASLQNLDAVSEVISVESRSAVYVVKVETENNSKEAKLIVK